MQTSFKNQTPLQTVVFRACSPGRSKDYSHAVCASDYKFTEIVEWARDLSDLKEWNLAKIRNKQLSMAKMLKPAWSLILDCDVILEKFRPETLPCEAVSKCWSPNYIPGGTNTSWWAIPRQILDSIPEFDENFIGMFFEDLDWMKRIGCSHNANSESFCGIHIPHPNIDNKDEVFEINRRYYNQKHGENL
jgi:hypothetical protein